MRFSEHLLVGNLGYVFGVAAADLDGDGDIDCADAGCDGFAGNGSGDLCEFGTESSCADGFDNVGVVLLGSDQEIKEGAIVKSTGEII